MSDSILLGEDSVAKQNITASEYQVQLTFSIITIIINSMASLPTIILNSMLLHIHIKNRKSPSKIIICNMTVTDILTGLLVQPAYAAHIIMDLQGTLVYSNFLFFSFTAYFVCGMSLITAWGMSIDRLLATVRPFSYKFYGKSRTYIVVVIFIWFQALVFVSLYTAGVIGRVMAQTVFILTVSFAMVSFIVSYAIIIKFMRKRERRVTRTTPSGNISKRKQSNAQPNKITKTFALMIIALCVMYLPMFVVKVLLWRAKSQNIVALNIANRLANTITFLNSLFNPILYCYTNNNTMQQLKELFLSCCGHFGRSSIQQVRTERIRRNNLANEVTSGM